MTSANESIHNEPFNMRTFRPKFPYATTVVVAALIATAALGAHRLSAYAQKEVEDDAVRSALVELHEHVADHVAIMRRHYPDDWSIERVCEQRRVEDNIPSITRRVLRGKAFKLGNNLDVTKRQHPALEYSDLYTANSLHFLSTCDARSMRLFDAALQSIGNEYEVKVPSLDLDGLPPFPSPAPVLVPAQHVQDPYINAFPHQDGVLLILTLMENGYWTDAEHYRMTVSYDGNAGEWEKLEHPGKDAYFRSFAIDKNATLYASGRGRNGRGILGRFGAKLTVYTGDIGYTEFVESTQNGVEIEMDGICHHIDEALKLMPLTECGRPQYQRDYPDGWKDTTSLPLTNAKGDTLTVKRNQNWLSVHGVPSDGGNPWGRKVTVLDRYDQQRLRGVFLSANGHMVVTVSHPKNNQFAIYLSKDSGQTWFHKDETPQS